MKVIVALTVKSNIRFPTKKKAHQAILELLPGAATAFGQTDNKNGTVTLTYNDNKEIEAGLRHIDDVSDLEIAKLAAQLRRKLAGLTGVKKVQVWWKYSKSSVRPSVQLLFF